MAARIPLEVKQQLAERRAETRAKLELRKKTVEMFAAEKAQADLEGRTYFRNGIPPNHYNWDHMAIGETRAFKNCHRSAVITSFNSWVKKRDMDWKCATRSDPASPIRGERCVTVWVTRIDPSDERAPAHGTRRVAPADYIMNGPFAMKVTGRDYRPPKDKNGRVINFHPYILDLESIPAPIRADMWIRWNDRIRYSKSGWDRMLIGQYEFVRSSLSTLRGQITHACLSRALLWAFELRRVESPEGEQDKRVWWVVSRIR